MKYYTDIIPSTLAEKLKEKGMPKDCGCNLCCYPPYNVEEEYTYGFVFDWLMEKRIYLTIYRTVDYYWRMDIIFNGDDVATRYNKSWRKAADKAIEKALTLI